MKPWLDDGDVRLYHAHVLDALRAMPDASVDCIITSPPYYGLRDYGTGRWEGGDKTCDHRQRKVEGDIPTADESGNKFRNSSRYAHQSEPYSRVCARCGARRVDDQIGLEETPAAFIATLVGVFREARRVLADHGTCWINLGSSYVSGGTAASPSRQRRHARACGSDGTALPGSTDPGFACLDLCDGCRGATQNHRDRNAGTTPPLALSVPPASSTSRGSEHQDSARAPFVAQLPASPASTPLGSLRPPPGECSHCANCGACLAVLRSASRDARLCARTAPSTNGTSSPSLPSAGRTQDTEPFALAYLYSTIESLTWQSKDMLPMPWLLGLALQADGWILRRDIIWSKPNPMPESVTDRCTSAHEYVFHLVKRPRYWYDADAVREAGKDWSTGGPGVGIAETQHYGVGNGGNAGLSSLAARYKAGDVAPGRNLRSVWEIATQPTPEAHFATFPEELVRRCLLAGCPLEVCRACGKPRERIVGERPYPAHLANAHKAHGGIGNNLGGQRHQDWLDANPRPVLGWSDCGHGAYRPGVVLDPFIGSGTTALVARKHQRHAIGIDLNAEYLAIAAKRLQQLSLLATEVTG